ncbi:hypothetical protein Cgig2_034199 [Carnegiea gigantea]|uniref:Uncharacterized protein n=1 Tax=Carnegiea gigantea TaxID=171969 RepID=A0A9Q1K0P0_9CARY|nr:hypothetical protein Cgig2_034199 [Carnegiea gigantea]
MTVLIHDEHMTGYVDFMHHTADRPAYAAEPFRQNSTLFVKGHLTSISGGKLDDPEENLSSFCRHQVTEAPSAGFDISATLNGPLYSSVADTFPRRFRPSFLDSLNIGRDLPVSGRQEAYTSSAKFSSSLGASSAMQEPSTACAPEEPRPMPASTNTTSGFFGSSFAGQKLFENNLESDLQRRRPDEDFAALEQHIEDLTQEKFSLQRTLEASKALSESLAAENSSLTESYNHQVLGDPHSIRVKNEDGREK